MESKPNEILEMHTLLLCADAPFLGTTRSVLNQLGVTPKIAGACDEVMGLIQRQEFNVIVVDWREINNLGEFLCAVHRSKLNRECVLVAIVRDLLDLRQAFAAGVHFLIHKPASAVQIERCLRAAYCATVVRRRKQHREAVNLFAALSTRSQAWVEVAVVNLGEGGAGIRLRPAAGRVENLVSAGEEVGLRFALPGGGEVHAGGTVVWSGSGSAGVRFTDMPDDERLLLERWLTGCVERHMAEMCERVRAVCA